MFTSLAFLAGDTARGVGPAALAAAICATALLRQAIVCHAFCKSNKRSLCGCDERVQFRILREVVCADLCDSRGRRSVLSYRCLTATDDAYLRFCHTDSIRRVFSGLQVPSSPHGLLMSHKKRVRNGARCAGLLSKISHGPFPYACEFFSQPPTPKLF